MDGITMASLGMTVANRIFVAWSVMMDGRSGLVMEQEWANGLTVSAMVSDPKTRMHFPHFS